MAEDIDPLGTRKDALDVFLEAKVADGFEIETNTDVHAIIVGPRDKGLLSRIGRGDEGRRHVVEVDADGVIRMSPAEPRRS